ncbi:MAG: MerR family transcriptional regulator [Nonomuraea muscovyensis]|nr:MerR family transcriptional regulator [Nonomuraea muscovyensis]
MEEDLLPIGQFARLSRLSVKQLRYYDELGLLVPAYVDADSGYRYYRASQARAALSIGLLRSLDVPLGVVGEVLSGSAGALESVRGDLEAELARRRRTLASLERVMSQGLPSAPVRLVTEPARPVLVVRERAAGPDDVARATSAGVARLTALAFGGGGGIAAPGQGAAVQFVGLFPTDLDDSVEVAVALVLAPGSVRGVSGDASVEVLPGGVFASATHVGPYDQISLTAHAVLAWCVTHLMICLEER